jgi:hypothetical protein
MCSQIYRAKAKLQGNMSEVCRKLSKEMAQEQTHFILNVIWLDGGLFIILPDGTHLARLNMQVADTLVDYVKLESIRLEALINKRNIFE